MNIRFEWTGTCESCGEPSNRYDFQTATSPRPSRTTIVLRGRVEMASGKVRRFPEDGKRVEVCYRCRCRWRRNQSFRLTSAETLAQTRERVLALGRTGVLTASAIARALGVRQSTVWTWLRGADVSTPTRTRSSAGGSRKQRNAPKIIPEATPT